MSFLPLHPYQTQAIQHILTHPRCAIFASMGAGKTRICLEAISQLDDCFPVLIVAPLRVAKYVWPAEVQKWTPYFTIQTIKGTPEQRHEALLSKAHIYTINFENLAWLNNTLLGSKFKTIIVDESSKLRGFRLRGGTKSTQALKQLDVATRFIELTGTPAPQGIIDLYGQLFFLDKGERLGKTWQAFTSRFFSSALMPGGYTKLTPYKNAFELATSKIKDITLTIDVKDYIDVAKPVSSIIEVDLPPMAFKKYKELEKEMTSVIKNTEITAVTVAAASNKCLQMTAGFVYDENKIPIDVHASKLEALDDILEEWAHRTVIVVYWFKESLTKLTSRYAQGHVLGDNIDDWNQGKIPLLFIHPQSAGHGLNLAEGGHVMVFYDVNWNLELYQQVIERIGPVRQAQAGFDRPVHLYHLLAKDTIDFKVMKVLEGKATVQTALLDELK